MRQLTQNEFKIGISDFSKMIKEDNCLFIYPTDTIYGLGCDATNHKAVEKLRKVKDRNTKPFSIIPPSKEWILKNCEVDDETSKYIDNLPGPVTLILKLKNKDAISPLTNADRDTIGVRIPDHWFSKCVGHMGFPIVTTSANKVGQNFMTKIDDLTTDIKGYVDFIIYEGEKVGRPSTIINLTKPEISIEERH